MVSTIRTIVSFIPLLLAILLALLGNAIQALGAGVMWCAAQARDFSTFIAGDKAPTGPFQAEQDRQLREVLRMQVRRSMTQKKDDSRPN